MIEMADPEFAAFLYNQKKKNQILQEDNNIQLAGLEHEERNWRLVERWHNQHGTPAEVKIVQNQIGLIQQEKEHFIQEREQMSQLYGMLDKLISLPDVQPHYKRIADTQQRIDDEWRLLK